MTLHFINNQHSICPMMAFTLSRYNWMLSIDGKKKKLAENNTKRRHTEQLLHTPSTVPLIKNH